MIENVQESHAGTYECQISASNIYTHNVTLNVIGKPVVVVMQPHKAGAAWPEFRAPGPATFDGARGALNQAMPTALLARKVHPFLEHLAAS